MVVSRFDANHIASESISTWARASIFEEVERMRKALKEAIEIIASKPVDDSPVYVFLKDLKPPAFAARAPRQRQTHRPRRRPLQVPPTPSASLYATW